MTEELKYFIENYWLFKEDWEKNKIVDAAKNINLKDIIYNQNIHNRRPIDFIDAIQNLKTEDLQIFLEWIKHQFICCALNHSNGPIPFLLNYIGIDLERIIEIRLKHEKENKK